MQGPVPVAFGSAGAVEFGVPGLRATDVWFSPGCALEEHAHPLTGFLVILSGGFGVDFSGLRRDCSPATVLVEPAQIPHANRIAASGAHVLVVQFDLPQLPWIDHCRGLLSSVRYLRNAAIAATAEALTHELRIRDGATALAVEADVLEMLAVAIRTPPPRETTCPPWLRRVDALIHDRFLDDLTLAELATEAAVHPVYLARTYRRCYRTSIAQRLRDLRLDWSAYQLVHGRTPISAIAHDARFADQAHFTRAFRHRHGLPPGRYRRDGRLAYGRPPGA